jgi:hypothetical protein
METNLRTPTTVDFATKERNIVILPAQLTAEHTFTTFRRNTNMIMTWADLKRTWADLKRTYCPIRTATRVVGVSELLQNSGFLAASHW